MKIKEYLWDIVGFAVLGIIFVAASDIGKKLTGK